MKAKLIFVLKLLVMALIFALVMRKMDIPKFLDAVRHAHIAYLIWAAVVIWVGHLFCIVRWRILLDVFKVPLRFTRLVAIYFLSVFAGICLPSLVGGDVFKFYLTGRETNQSYTMPFASVFMDRNLGLFALVLIAFGFSILKPVSLRGVSMLPITGLMTFGFAAVNFILFYPKVHTLVSRVVAARAPNVTHRLDILSSAFVSLFRDRRAVVNVMLLSGLNHLTSVVVAWLIARALGEPVPFLYFLVFIPITNLVAMIPLTPMGMGLRESALISLCTSVLHMSVEKSLAIGILISGLMLLTSLPGGLFYLTFKRHGEMDRISEATTVV